ncbi:MAG: tetratricopeptide repeat protein [Bacteroidales bacterium]|nr:tetratricopeptide repeat protein [Bacteroidales bacterium]
MKKFLLFISWLTIFSCSFLYANNQQFSFYNKALLHYKKELAASPKNILENNTNDSILININDSVDLQKALSVSWKIGLFLLEQGKHPKALDIFNDIRSFLETKHNKTKEDQKKISSIYNIIGAIYEETGLWNEALDLYMHSLQICNENNNMAGKAKVFNNLGKLYFSRNELDKAEGLFFKAIEINKALNIRSELFNNYNNLGGIFKQRDNIKKALEYTLIALNQLDINKDFYNLSIIYSNIGNLYQDIGNYPVALSYYQQAADIQEKKSFLIALIHSDLSISSVYEIMRNSDSATGYLSKSLHLAENLGNPSVELELLRASAKFYQKRGNFKLSSGYYANYVNLNDSLEALNSLTKIEQIQAVYEVINKEKDNKILQQKINLQRLALQRQRIILITGLIIFIFLGYFLFNLQGNRKRERIKNEFITRQTELLHQKEKEMMLNKEQNLTIELDYKNRQLTSYALHLVRNNEFISKTSDELKQILLSLSSIEKEKANHIQGILSDFHQYSTGNDWEEFHLYFEEVHQSFYQNLATAFPNLSQNDKKICAFLKLGLSTKEIASITFRELRSVESARNRLRKKLGIAADVNINNFLSQF